MSTENESPTTEGLHPEWCDFEGECTDKIVSHAVHYGRRTVWIPSVDGQRVGIALRHGEDRVIGDPVDHGTRTIELSISRGGDDVGEDVMLTADDARFLAQQMVAYAQAVDRDPRWYTREHLGMSAVEYAESIGLIAGPGEPVSMSVTQAAGATSLTEACIRDAIFEESLQAHVVGKRIVILPTDLRAWVAGHRLVEAMA